jgi:anti-sigma B factor antagonist
MNARLHTDSTGIRVSGEMTVYAACALKQPLLDALAGGARLLDLSEVSEFDTAGLQLVLLAQREAAAAGRDLIIPASSNIVRETLSLAGCMHLLVRPAVEQDT